MKFDVDKIKRLSIEDYLLKCGHKPVQRTGKFRSFYSPFSRESNASFKVNTAKNTWYDYHEGCGGDLIDLVMRVERLSFPAACRFLDEGSSVNIEEYTPVRKQVSGVKIVSSNLVSDKKLINYFVDKRKIAESILKKYCREIEFSFPYGKNPDRVHRAIGFENDLGGWELRSDWLKVSTQPKSFTSIEGNKKKANVFEGFTDFLSALTYFRVDKPKYRTYILNGVGQINVLKPLLENIEVNLYVDADEAGDGVKNALGRVNDCRHYFSFYGDFNERLQNL